MFRPVRPAAYLPDVTAIMESAQRAAAAGTSGPFPQRSAFNPIPQTPLVYPTDLSQLQLFSQLGQFLPQQAGIPDLQQLTGGGGDSQAASGSRGKAKGSSSDKASSAYASRHQAAEQRRRNRINER